ncbi:MAG: outer membrane beta-barrel protein, partial [Myxococcales bacterium]
MPIPILATVLVAQVAPPAQHAGVELHGWADVFYAVNPNRPADGASFLPGTGTTARRANEMNLNAAALDVSLAPDPVGFHLTAGFGSGFDVVHAAEIVAPAVSPEIWRSVYQASVSYKAPIGRG